ncbi:hypothetical protein [Muricoccus radiodurans]|uniref:hypothetical protein n=1 Tax=Muricoccus radiodurans TaxID=2231721 RepID=UPI003CF69BF3
MAVFADGRVPVEVVTDRAALAASLAARPSAAVLSEGVETLVPEGASTGASLASLASAHAVGCACCAGAMRSPVAQALDRLFLGRMTRSCPWFDRVVALLPDPAARDALATILREDPVIPSRFRLEVGPPPPPPVVEKFPPDEP